MTLEVLDCYMDSSGKDTNANDKVLAVSGCLSTPLKWQEFDNDWQEFLKAEGFPVDATTGRYVFHTSPFWVTGTQTKREKQRIIRNLIEITTKHTLFRFGYIVLLDHFRELETEIPYMRELLSGKPGTFINEVFIKENSDWAKQKGYDPAISYVSDRGEEFWGELFGKYSLGNKILNKGEFVIPEDQYRGIASLTCADKVRFSGIQAADLIAWQCRQSVMNQRPIQWKSTLASSFRPKPELALLYSQGNSHFKVFNKEALRQVLLNKFGWMLKMMNLEDTTSILVGEGKVFEDLEKLMKFGLEIRKKEDIKLHKERQAEAKLKKKKV